MITSEVKLKLIYPKWNKLPGQTTFNLPPHGPVVYAASLPEYVDVSFTDENVEELNFDEPCDVVAISMMLSTQVKRGWAIADKYRAKGIPVMFGPNNRRFQEAQGLLAQGLLAAQGGFEVTDYESFAQLMDRFTQDKDYLSEAGKNAARFVSENAGATNRILSEVI